MADVFISYKRDQRERVKVIADLLKAEELSVWFDANLEVGHAEGFDAEIEREVTSAHCVLACWTPEAVRSIYVKAESKKGLDNDTLVPVYLEQCILPVPFNAIDTADLINWRGDKHDPTWNRIISRVKEKIEHRKASEYLRREHSKAAYERIEEKIYPGTMTLLSLRIAALHDQDAVDYQDDIEALLQWVNSIVEKELRLRQFAWEEAERYQKRYLQHGFNGQDTAMGAWRFWDAGYALHRAKDISKVRLLLTQIDRTLSTSEELLRRSSP
jgi:hypothetical protein